jgi:hypothetical protein
LLHVRSVFEFMAYEDGGRKGVREGRKDRRTQGAAGAAAVAFIQATECDSSSSPSYNCRESKTNRSWTARNQEPLSSSSLKL